VYHVPLYNDARYCSHAAQFGNTRCGSAKSRQYTAVRINWNNVIQCSLDCNDPPGPLGLQRSTSSTWIATIHPVNLDRNDLANMDRDDPPAQLGSQRSTSSTWIATIHLANMDRNDPPRQLGSQRSTRSTWIATTLPIWIATIHLVNLDRNDPPRQHGSQRST
jgi:hypothetical protein